MTPWSLCIRDCIIWPYHFKVTDRRCLKNYVWLVHWMDQWEGRISWTNLAFLTVNWCILTGLKTTQNLRLIATVMPWIRIQKLKKRKLSKWNRNAAGNKESWWLIYMTHSCILDKFYFRWLENSVIEIGKAV